MINIHLSSHHLISHIERFFIKFFKIFIISLRSQSTLIFRSTSRTILILLQINLFLQRIWRDRFAFRRFACFFKKVILLDWFEILTSIHFCFFLLRFGIFQWNLSRSLLWLISFYNCCLRTFRVFLCCYRFLICFHFFWILFRFLGRILFRNPTLYIFSLIWFAFALRYSKFILFLYLIYEILCIIFLFLRLFCTGWQRVGLIIWFKCLLC